ncbi:MAG: hypothetical protein U0174_19020 [Polyangiaceae bacterium]
MAYGKRGVTSLFVALWLAACGGKVVDAPLGSNKADSPGTPTPPSATATTPVPIPVPTTTSTATPVGPLPTGPLSQCGLLAGDREQLLSAFGRARSLGIYEVTAVVEECSGAGGLHMMLQRILGCGPTKTVHFGEHTCMSDAPYVVGDRVVVGVAPESGSSEFTTVWCLEDIKPWDGVARAIRKVQPGETDAQVLAKYICSP